MSLVGDGIGHVAFAGIGAGLLLGIWPVWTALLFAVGGAVGVEILRTRRKASGDLALALFFYAGIALGVVFASRAGNLDFETLPYLFGDPYKVGGIGVAGIVGIGIVVSALVIWLRRPLFAVVTDEDWARVAGLPVDLLNIMLAALTAAVIVAGMRVVGILLVAALMVLPVASAQLIARSFAGTIRLAVAIGAVAAVVGLAAGRLLNIEPGGAIVLTAAAVFAVIAIARRSASNLLRFEEHG
jgi:zinc transport system permease protein